MSLLFFLKPIYTQIGVWREKRKKKKVYRIIKERRTYRAAPIVRENRAEIERKIFLRRRQEEEDIMLLGALGVIWEGG